MERVGQNNNRKFEGGIFSGTSPEMIGGPYGGNVYNGNACRNNGAGRMNDNNYYHVPNYGGYNRYVNCANCANYKKNDNTALILAVIVAAVVILIAFFATILCLISVIFILQNQTDKEVKSFPYNNFQYENEIGSNQKETENAQEIPIPPFEEWSENAPSKEAATGEYYGELRDAVRTDLDYSIEWENYEYEGNNERIMIAVDYPVIKGNMPNKNVINDEIKSETEYFVEYYNEYSKYMLPDETFGVYAEGYVTYMDEEKMSVVFCETIYTDYGVDCGLFCINIDVENGIILDNSSILKVDEAFITDFRSRSKAQNGEVNELSYMTDQELTYCLSTKGTSILFYTPMGMEVGVNYGVNYLTVTYADYEKFLLKY